MKKKKVKNIYEIVEYVTPYDNPVKSIQEVYDRLCICSGNYIPKEYVIDKKITECPQTNG